MRRRRLAHAARSAAHESYRLDPGAPGAGERRRPRRRRRCRWSTHEVLHALAPRAQFCEVRVNAVTGEVRVAPLLGSFDCGRILNPKTAASQFRGGIIMGLAWR